MDVAAQTPSALARPSKLNAKDVMKQTEALYRRLFFRSIGISAAVFAVVKFVDTFVGSGAVGGAILALLSLALTLIGYAFVEGALVEVVRDLHDDGDGNRSYGEIVDSTRARLAPLTAVSLLTGFTIALGCLLFIVPGLVLLTRWAVAVPVVMLEGRSPSDAMRRSRELVRGNGRAVLNVVLTVGFMTAIVGFFFAIIARGNGFFVIWLAGTVAATLTAPYAAHAVTVLYYRLTEPERPVVLAPGKRWLSIWDAQHVAMPSDEASAGTDAA
jgi:hypothetical protein